MLLDLCLMLISIGLFIGFITGKADWLLIYYGCAPKQAKEKMNGSLIMTIAWASMFAISILLGVNVLMQYMQIYFLVYLFRWICLGILMLMIISTFYIAQIHGKNKIKKLMSSGNTYELTDAEREEIRQAQIERSNKEAQDRKSREESKKKKGTVRHQKNTMSKNQRIQEALKNRK